MIVSVNNKSQILDPDSNLDQLREVLGLPDWGIAMAVNNQIIPKGEWPFKQLTDNDKITIIQATPGG